MQVMFVLQSKPPDKVWNKVGFIHEDLPKGQEPLGSLGVSHAGKCRRNSRYETTDSASLQS